jgi:hypothetical protein
VQARTLGRNQEGRSPVAVEEPHLDRHPEEGTSLAHPSVVPGGIRDHKPSAEEQLHPGASSYAALAHRRQQQARLDPGAVLKDEAPRYHGRPHDQRQGHLDQPPPSRQASSVENR